MFNNSRIKMLQISKITLSGFMVLLLLIVFSTASVPTRSNALYGQQNGTLRGLITDSTTSEALAYASVSVKELRTGAYTDSKGYFVITPIPAGKTFTLVVSYTGYLTRSFAFSVSHNKMAHLDIRLVPSSILLPTVETIGKKVLESNATNISVQHISMKQLELMPKGVETDIFRSLHYIPGVRSTGDISARYYIRGGASNQNLVQMNGATIYNPFHALGLFSVIDPEMVNSAEFFKGGFPAEYGGRLSSVLNLSTKDGNKNNYSSRVSASYLSAKALIEGPIPDGSFILTGRRSFSEKIYQKFLNKSMPLDFYDLSFKLNYSNRDFVEGSKLTAYGFASSDNMKYDDPTKADLNWENKLFGFNWFQVSDSPLFFEVGLSWSSFLGEVTPNLSAAKDKRNEVNDVTMKANFNYVYESKDELGLGLNIVNLNTKLFLQNLNGAYSDIGTYGTNFCFFAKYKFLRFDNIGVDVGTRINLTGLTQEGGGFFNEPRISFTLRPLAQIAIKGAWGIFQQEVATLSDENEVLSLFEPWIITPSYLSPSRATHYILGIETDFTENISLELEGYYKKMENIPALNENKIYSSDRDLVSGSGEAYGFESMFKMNLSPVTFTGSYSLSWAYNTVNNWVYYPKYDARHACNFALEYAFADGWQFSATWIFSTGLPYTRLAGFYDKLKIDDFYSLYNIYSSFQPFLLLADKNLGRLPAYHRMDLSLSKKFVTNLFNLYLDVSVLNVYDRKNIFYFERDTGNRVNMLPFLPTATVKIEI